ncbi:ABCB family ABC transporter ATP-binding protein/permease [Desertibaculum subflavum]|uniref:ABCB family ABC transporter ATP-binding protein/permease n=1 Tax=Desertibaculum subflavum TaxID=2268458 RepID=UPI000E66400A
MQGFVQAPAGEPPSRGHLKTIATLLRYLWPPGRVDLKARVVAAAVLIVLAKLANVSVPFFYKDAVDALDRPAVALVAVPVALILAYGLARIMAQAFGELRNAIFAKVSQHAVRTIALETFQHLHRLSLRFHLERQTGGLSRAIERGNAGIQFALSFTLFNILPTLFEIGLVVALLLLRYDGWFASATLVTIVLYVAVTLVMTEWRIKLRREMNERDAEANTRAIDSLLNYETVKYFGNEPHEASRYDRALERYQHAAVQSELSLSALNVGQGIIIAGGLVTVMLLAAQGVARGEMTLGDFVLVNTFLIQLYQPLNILGMVYREVKQSLVDMERMFNLLAVDEEVRDAPGATPLRLEGGEVEFDDVQFAYDLRRPILKGVSFRVPAGRTVAIVGASGAGKSTISRLLFRFYDVQSGAIRIDGQDIRQVTQASLRAAIGIVPQDTVLFNDTIRYNIRYGRPRSDEDEIRRAARLAKIDHFVDHLPDNWRTKVGERGLKLSGGEKQRVAIARTILKDPKILLFDEATSALDTRTEKEIQASLREVSENRTTLIIAHRLSTIVHADEILVLEGGQVVERGRHADLLAQAGHYAEMWARQQEAAEARERIQAVEEAEAEEDAG